MTQYLLNATAIWLISLLSYDIFLRKETYHNYNRFYLLFTFLLGALLPMVQWQSPMANIPGPIQKPIEQVVNAKKNVVEATTVSTASINWEQWLLTAYIIGALVVFLLLLNEVIKLAVLYSTGKKYVENKRVIIETSKDHAPFSFLNIFFISSRKLYTDEEWKMIMVHEGRHYTLLHFIDLLLIQLSKIVFWFHPLVYAFNTRLLLVHEYQADIASARQPEVYGKFLVEQSILQSAPLIAHSFNRSPIKKRILMLTRKSTTLAKSKMLVFIPVALACFLCFSKNSLSQSFQRKGNIATWRGNTVELSETTYDTMIIIDPVTGGEITKVSVNGPEPVKLNGKLIPRMPDEDPVFTGNGIDLRKYLLVGLKQQLSKLDDGFYNLDINDILVDEHGKVAYFSYSDMKRSKTRDEIKTPATTSGPIMINAHDPEIKVKIDGQPDGKNGTFNVYRTADPNHYEPVNKKDQDAIFKQVCALMEVAPAFKPATLNGKNVAGIYIHIKLWNSFKVKEHKVYDVEVVKEVQMLNGDYPVTYKEL